MADQVHVFSLPDVGEGLTEAEILAGGPDVPEALCKIGRAHV